MSLFIELTMDEMMYNVSWVTNPQKVTSLQHDTVSVRCFLLSLTVLEK